MHEQMLDTNRLSETVGPDCHSGCFRLKTAGLDATVMMQADAQHAEAAAAAEEVSPDDPRLCGRHRCIAR